MVYLIFCCLTIPMVLLLPLLEHKSRFLIGFFLLGTLSALCAYALNTLVFPLTGMEARAFSQVVAPITEELLKALPVLFYALWIDDRRRSVLPIAMAVGIGFAVLENSVLLVDNLGAATIAWTAGRGFSACLMHGLCTVVVGTGITYVKKQRQLFYPGFFGLLSLAILLHALFDLLIQSPFAWIGLPLPLLLYGLLYCLRRSKRIKLPFLLY